MSAPVVAAKAARATRAAGAGGATARAATTGGGTVQARGAELLAQGRTRKDAARIIRDEYGSTLAEALGSLPPEVPADPPAPSPADGTTAPPAPSPAGRAPSSPTVPRAVRKAAASGGSAILATLTYVLALTYLRGGSAGVKRWLRAKFLNQVDGAS